jgi:hypothetical protein
MAYSTIAMYLCEAQFRVLDKIPPADGQIDAPDEINKVIPAVLAKQSFFLSET